MDLDKDTVLGNTPWTSTFPRGSRALRLAITRSGYKAKTTTVSLARDAFVEVQLSRKLAPKPGEKEDAKDVKDVKPEPTKEDQEEETDDPDRIRKL